MHNRCGNLTSIISAHTESKVWPMPVFPVLGGRDRRTSGAYLLANLAELVSTSPVRNPISNGKLDTPREMTPKVDL